MFLDRPLEKIEERHESESDAEDFKHEEVKVKEDDLEKEVDLENEGDLEKDVKLEKVEELREDESIKVLEKKSEQTKGKFGFKVQRRILLEF